MRAGLTILGAIVGLTMSSMPTHAQEKTGGDEFASDGGAAARWWNEKAEQYPKCSGPAKQGATLTGQIWEEAYKKPEDVQKVHELGAQREGVKRELQMCIAQNYQVKPPLQGGIKQDEPADPGAKGPYDGGTTGTGSGGNGKPSTGKGGSGKPGAGKTPPPKKTPPLSGGANKGGGANTLPGYPYPLPPQTGHGNAGHHDTPPVWVGTTDITWVQAGTPPGSTVPGRVNVKDTIVLQIWDMTDPNVYLDKNGSLFGVVGKYNNGTFEITRPVWRNLRTQRKDLKYDRTVTLRHP